MIAKLTGISPDATIKPLPMNPEPNELQAERNRLDEEFLLLQQRQADLTMKENLAAEMKKTRMFDERQKALDAAAGFRREARATQDENEKRNLYEWAREADEEARRLELELGIVSHAEPSEEPAIALPWMQRHKKLTAMFQVLGVLLLIQFCYSQFMAYKEHIDALNGNLAIDQRLQPYDLTSIQKFFFEQLSVFSSLPIALVILFLIVPFVGFYVLPFLKSRKDFYTEFYEDLTPWQRSIITTALLLGLLFFLALSHTVKP
ncbi:hypothetical protein LX87_04092 [Larkinella arboricola]|uniref:Uncharacterized protein n=1 Tax=Larkinella arboricola TaxID=643671 RepID=A0A327WSH0_LARAB|nr:hypothetical protein [Larkinella arboricola]RAJ94207.1 hypothetical protein LX87_04092 [Larkinella arboricola]